MARGGPPDARAVASADGHGGENYDYELAVWPITNDALEPESLEVEPNDDVGAAPVLPLPAVTRGTISTADDADCWRFEVTGMCTVVVDLHSQPYGTPLDARVELYSASGAKVWRSDDTDGVDPRFNLVIPMHGVYGLRVTSRDGGDASCGYFLSSSWLSPPVGPDIIIGIPFFFRHS